jgi:mycothiol system anti-sigma-R factor
MGALDDCGPLCQETLREIERFLDGELDRVVSVRIEEHLSDCHPCMQRTEFRRHLKVLVAEKCSERAAPGDLSRKIRDLIRGLDDAPSV